MEVFLKKNRTVPENPKVAFGLKNVSFRKISKKPKGDRFGRLKIFRKSLKYRKSRFLFNLSKFEKEDPYEQFGIL